MLSYQHGYHAGNLADVHKHAALSWVIAYMTAKDKPMSYIETHGGRGVYDLSGDQALKTGEAEAGIARAEAWFDTDHPYADALAACRAEYGPDAYPGSPWIASYLLREDDVLHVAELHPAEHAALRGAVPGAHIYRQDGFDTAYSQTPPTPRRGLMLVDPSYEVKSDYTAIPPHFAKIARAWPVGVLMLWYPILPDGRHNTMVQSLANAFPDALRHEVAFLPAREGHGMIGSGLFVVNPPWGLDDALAGLSECFDAL